MKNSFLNNHSMREDINFNKCSDFDRCNTRKNCVMQIVKYINLSPNSFYDGKKPLYI